MELRRGPPAGPAPIAPQAVKAFAQRLGRALLGQAAETLAERPRVRKVDNRLARALLGEAAEGGARVHVIALASEAGRSGGPSSGHSGHAGLRHQTLEAPHLSGARRLRPGLAAQRQVTKLAEVDRRLPAAHVHHHAPTMTTAALAPVRCRRLRRPSVNLTDTDRLKAQQAASAPLSRELRKAVLARQLAEAPPARASACAATACDLGPVHAKRIWTVGPPD